MLRLTFLVRQFLKIKKETTFKKEKKRKRYSVLTTNIGEFNCVQFVSGKFSG